MHYLHACHVGKLNIYPPDDGQRDDTGWLKPGQLDFPRNFLFIECFGAHEVHTHCCAAQLVANKRQGSVYGNHRH